MTVERSFSVTEWTSRLGVAGRRPPGDVLPRHWLPLALLGQVIAHLPGRHCFALDFRGHGHSTKLPAAVSLEKFRAGSCGAGWALDLSGAIGVGHSMGGHSGTFAAALRPAAFSALVLIDPVIRSRGTYTGPWAEAQFAAKRRNQWSSALEMFERFKDRPPFLDWGPLGPARLLRIRFTGGRRSFCTGVPAPSGSGDLREQLSASVRHLSGN